MRSTVRSRKRAPSFGPLSNGGMSLRRQLAGEEPVLLSDQGDRHWPDRPAAPDSLAEIDSRADALRRNLDELLRKYTEEHPDVVGTRRILADLDKQREAMLEAKRRADLAHRSPAARAECPTWSTSSSRVSLAEAEANVAALAGRLSDLESRYNRLRANGEAQARVRGRAGAAQSRLSDTEDQLRAAGPTARAGKADRTAG